MKFHDQNGDGIRNTGEPGLENWIIFVDLNRDGILNYDDVDGVDVAIEPFAKTDASGSYTITGVLPGNHPVVEIRGNRWEPTTPTSSDAFDFSNLPLNSSPGFGVYESFNLVGTGGRAGALNTVPLIPPSGPEVVNGKTFSLAPLVFAGGSGKELVLSNIGIGVELGGVVDEVQLRYGVVPGPGIGNLNFQVNGELLKLTSLSALSGTKVGGADVTVSSSGSQGTITIRGTVYSLSLAAGLLAIDDVLIRDAGVHQVQLGPAQVLGPLEFGNVRSLDRGRHQVVGRRRGRNP